MDFLKRFQAAGIDPTLDAFSAGISHHSKSEEVVRLLVNIDVYFFGDYFSWKVGGDGDNGETLMYELDLIFSLLDYESKAPKND